MPSFLGQSLLQRPSGLRPSVTLEKTLFLNLNLDSVSERGCATLVLTAFLFLHIMISSSVHFLQMPCFRSTLPLGKKKSTFPYPLICDGYLGCHAGISKVCRMRVLRMPTEQCHSLLTFSCLRNCHTDFPVLRAGHIPTCSEQGFLLPFTLSTFVVLCLVNN